MAYSKRYKRIIGDNILDIIQKNLHKGDETVKRHHDRREQSKKNCQQTIENRTPETKKLIEEATKAKQEKADLHLTAKAYIEENKLKLKEAILEEAKKSGAKHALEIYAEDIKNFEQACADYNRTASAYNPNMRSYKENTLFNKFLSSLAREDVNFCLYCPVGIFFGQFTVNLSKFNKEELAIIEKKFEQAGMFKHSSERFSNMKTNYLKYFPNYIDLIDDAYDVAFCLKLDCTKYPIVKDKFINDYTGTLKNFKYLLDNVPEVIKAFDEEEFKILACNDLGFGKKLFKNPDLIKYFPINFFDEEENIITIFATTAQSKIEEVFGDRLDKYPNLKAYAQARSRKFPRSKNSNEDLDVD